MFSFFKRAFFVSKGVVSWDDPTTSDIKTSASLLALSLPKITPFIFYPFATFRQITTNRVDIALWIVGAETLVLATNMNYFSAEVSLRDLGLANAILVTQVLDSGAAIDPSTESDLLFDSVGSGAFIVKSL